VNNDDKVTMIVCLQIEADRNTDASSLWNNAGREKYDHMRDVNIDRSRCRLEERRSARQLMKVMTKKKNEDVDVASIAK
jgi:hypothetical protein